MSWQDLIQSETETLVLPWLGGRKVHKLNRTWRVHGRLPGEHGWYSWQCRGRRAELVGPAEPDEDYEHGRDSDNGYLIGNRFAPLAARVEPDPKRLVEQTVPIYLVEPGLDRFAAVMGCLDEEGRYIYTQEVFGFGPEDEVRDAYVDRKDSLDHISGVPPALDLAFRFATQQRLEVEERRAAIEREMERQRRMEEARRNMGTGAGRRILAETDPAAAAKAALLVGGAELLDVRGGRVRNEIVVQYRMENRRLECVADRRTLRIIDAGVCLTDHDTGEKGDTMLTLESLPGVIRQAINEGRLVVWRHVD